MSEQFNILVFLNLLFVHGLTAFEIGSLCASPSRFSINENFGITLNYE